MYVRISELDESMRNDLLYILRIGIIKQNYKKSHE
jgi:hypothetical protein